MSDDLDNTALMHFVEEFGLMMEASGLPRMAGRIMGWLLVCDPPHQSSAQLAATLHASRGSISTMTRLLHQAAIIERLTLPRERTLYFQIKPSTFIQLTKVQVTLIAKTRSITQEGLSILADAPPRRRERLAMMDDFLAFCEAELPRVFERWVAERASKAGGPEETP